MNKKEKFVRVQRKSNEDYKKTLNKIIKTKKCPFCPENFLYHKKPILKKYRKWIATENSWPYENAQHHFLLIPIAHKVDFSQLTSEDFSAIRYLVSFLKKDFSIEGGGITVRFGDPVKTGSTVSHIHFHFIVPKTTKSKEKPVYFPIG